MMRRVFLRDCAAGDAVDDVFVLTGKQFSLTNSGKNFIKAFLGDRTAQVSARMWNATRELFNVMPDGGFARVRGHVENYQGNLQFIIEAVAPAMAGSYDLADLLPHTKKDIPQMCRRIAEILGSIQNRHLSALVQAYLDDEKLMTDFCRAPAAMSFHHAFLGGLLEHTLNAIEVADAVCRFYPLLSRDLVLAGIFLHDIAKTWELNFTATFSYSDGGQLVGHIVKSAIWVEQKAKEAEAILGEPIPQPLIDVIQHIILSHHGVPEFGAAKVPATPEAIAVHMIENMDAKLMTSLEACRGGGINGEGNWTEFNKSFGGRLYRPDLSLHEPMEDEAPPMRIPVRGADAESKPRQAPTQAPINHRRNIAEQPAPAAPPAAAPSPAPASNPPAALPAAPTEPAAGLSAAGPASQPAAAASSAMPTTAPAAPAPSAPAPPPNPESAPPPPQRHPPAHPGVPQPTAPLRINNPLFDSGPPRRK